MARRSLIKISKLQQKIKFMSNKIKDSDEKINERKNSKAKLSEIMDDKTNKCVEQNVACLSENRKNRNRFTSQ